METTYQQGRAPRRWGPTQCAAPKLEPELLLRIEDFHFSSVPFPLLMTEIISLGPPLELSWQPLAPWCSLAPQWPHIFVNTPTLGKPNTICHLINAQPSLKGLGNAFSMKHPSLLSIMQCYNLTFKNHSEWKEWLDGPIHKHPPLLPPPSFQGSSTINIPRCVLELATNHLMIFHF